MILNKASTIASEHRLSIRINRFQLSSNTIFTNSIVYKSKSRLILTSDQQVNLKTNERSLQNETKLKISYF